VAVAATHDAVWVAKEGDDSVSRIDVRVGTPGKPISVGDAPAAIAVGGGAVWVANAGDGSVTRIDQRMNRVAGNDRRGPPTPGHGRGRRFGLGDHTQPARRLSSGRVEAGCASVFDLPHRRDDRPGRMGRLAEQRGFDSLWLPEHTHMLLDHKPYAPGGEVPRQYLRTLDPFVAVTASPRRPRRCCSDSASA
jgi:hypothetical protein